MRPGLSGGTLGGEDQKHAARFAQLVERLDRSQAASSGYGVPYIVLADTPVTSAAPSSRDPVQILFERVNQGGTRLEGEELIYAMLKSSWPEASELIDEMGHRLAQPSRLVVLAARLVLADRSPPNEKKPPPTPDVIGFRRLLEEGSTAGNVASPSFPEDLRRFVAERGSEVFDTARRLLTEGDYALPPALAVELAQRSPAVMFLLLRWIVRMRGAQLDPLALNDDKRKRLLGFLTALAWFSADQELALAALWPTLQSADAAGLKRFFGRVAFKRCLSLDEKGRVCVLPVVPPEVLEKVIKNTVTAPHGEWALGGFADASSELWKQWHWYGWLSDHVSRPLATWFATHLKADWAKKDAPNEDESADSRFQWAWGRFIDGLRYNRSMLLFAQRAAINDWFEDFYPFGPEHVTGSEAPWDFDHIHPRRRLRNARGNSLRIPNLVREWHDTIGNLRAWPMELNRSDSDASPGWKMAAREDTDAEILRSYNLDSTGTVVRASFILDADLGHWQATAPDDDGPADFLEDYLSTTCEDHGWYRQQLVRAITTRFCALYRHWYEELKLAELMPAEVSE